MIPPGDLDYLSDNGYIQKATKADFDEWSQVVARLPQITAQVDKERAEADQASLLLQQDQSKAHSIRFYFQGREEKDALRQKVEAEIAATNKEESEARAVEDQVNQIIETKSMVDRMVSYQGGYVSLTGLGSLVLNDLNVRDYRVSDEEFSDFSDEIKATYAELRSIADKATYHVNVFKQELPGLLSFEYEDSDEYDAAFESGALSAAWGSAIGLAKLQGDTNAVAKRFIASLHLLKGPKFTIASILMSAEIMTAMSNLDLDTLQAGLKTLDKQLKDLDVPDDQSGGVAAALLAGRRYDGTYPLDRYEQFRHVTTSYETAAVLAVMNIPFGELSAKFQSFRDTFASWGYMKSEDTELASAFLAIGELESSEVSDKLKYIVDQLKNYLEYPLVAAAILASIPVFEAHEVLDLMEKAVTLLSAYVTQIERSQAVALAVRMIHGVRNEIVKKIDSTAPISKTPVQFTYSSSPGLFIHYYPMILVHSYYHSSFAFMGGFHPAHSHGVGGFAG